jgi:hypothetical protein
MADFDPTKPVATRDGRPARIVCSDRKGGAPIIALVTNPDGTEGAFFFHPNGQSILFRNSPHDLVNIPERVSLFYNVYSGGARTCRYATLAEALTFIHPTSSLYIGTIEIVREGGEGGVIVERKIHNLLENNNG